MYVKMYEQIFNSSIMEEDIETRYVWMCLLILSDKEGYIDMTIPSIARRINIDTPVVKRAIEIFSQPDETSRTPTSDGKRLEKIRDSFGWKIINYQYFRDLRDEDARREYMRNYMAEKRKVNKKLTKANATNAELTVNTNKHLLAHTDTDTNTTTDTTTKEKDISSSEQKTVRSTLGVGFDMPPNIFPGDVEKSNTPECSTLIEHSSGGNVRITKEDHPIVVGGSGDGELGGGAEHSSDYIPSDDENPPVELSGGDQEQCAEPETTTKGSTEQGFVLPDWIPKQQWGEYVEMRKKIKRPMTEAAMKLAVNSLEKLRQKGYGVVEVINQSILNSWQGLFPLKENYENKQSGGTNSDYRKRHFGLNEKDYTEAFELS